MLRRRRDQLRRRGEVGPAVGTDSWTMLRTDQWFEEGERPGLPAETVLHQAPRSSAPGSGALATGCGHPFFMAACKVYSSYLGPRAFNAGGCTLKDVRDECNKISFCLEFFMLWIEDVRRCFSSYHRPLKETAC